VRHIALSREPVTEMYRPFDQTGPGPFAVVVKTAGEPGALVPSARGAVQAVDRTMPVYDVRTMEDRIAGSFAQTRGTMLLLLVTAALAAALSSVAIYGSIWYSVSQRLPEIGIRLALGASRGSVFLDVLRRAVVLTGAGSALGLAASLAAGRLIAGLLFETTATDPATHALVIVGTMTLALVAGLVPARRATRVDPMTALRNEGGLRVGGWGLGAGGWGLAEVAAACPRRRACRIPSPCPLATLACASALVLQIVT
jgi:putative ABC transport system permease protein